MWKTRSVPFLFCEVDVQSCISDDHIVSAAHRTFLLIPITNIFLSNFAEGGTSCQAWRYILQEWRYIVFYSTENERLIYKPGLIIFFRQNASSRIMENGWWSNVITSVNSLATSSALHGTADLQYWHSLNIDGQYMYVMYLYILFVPPSWRQCIKQNNRVKCIAQESW